MKVEIDNMKHQQQTADRSAMEAELEKQWLKKEIAKRNHRSEMEEKLVYIDSITRDRSKRMRQRFLDPRDQIKAYLDEASLNSSSPPRAKV